MARVGGDGVGGKRLAIDVGGTFVDFVLFDEATGAVRTEKEPSLVTALPDHVLSGLDRLEVEASDLERIIHGSTVVINTILQETGGSVGVLTTEGFRDVLELGRGNRPEVYNLLYKPPPPLVPRYLRFDVPERVDYRGEVLRPLDEAATRKAVARLKERGVEGIAICFLHAYANPEHERRAREIAREVYPEAHVSISSEITGEFREFERTSTVVLNAYVMPKVTEYLGELERRLEERGFAGSLHVIQSTGGLMGSDEARYLPVRTLESGPAGGVIGAVTLGSRLGHDRLIAADVGGTSFDVALILDGRPAEKSRTEVNARPVLQPSVDIASVGAGGGSIAWIDPSGAFRVGPQSAEADPGPVCFGRGGTEPTVTDAHVVLGRINPENFLGRRMTLDVEAARRAIRDQIAGPLELSLEEAAHGITHLADTNMIHAIRRVTIERGHDPREFSLLVYGGAGGLFAGSLVREMQVGQGIVPLNPAVFSAWGILNADFRDDAVRTFVRPTADVEISAFRSTFDDLATDLRRKMEASGLDTGAIDFLRFVDMRYEGQEHTVKVPAPPDAELEREGMGRLQELFDRLHERAYAHASPGSPTELVNLRLAALVESRKPEITEIANAGDDGAEARRGTREVYFHDLREAVPCPTYDRGALRGGNAFEGPAIVEEWNSTVIVHPGQQLEVDRFGDLLIRDSGKVP